ncbi:DUF1993 domain-containing protein [Bdellovibrio bacteriovorus]|uniref:DUF1993 domain-containing protein n=1 Tax=Bdellovibrio bacteriovorus TaxID=959 RepID=UPI003A80320B
MLYEMTVPPFIKTLKNLSAILDKGAHLAETKKFDVEVLLNSRLAPDQFPLTRQIQIACDTAKLGVARLTGKEAPSHPDTEKTLPELKTRIESTIAFLESVSAKDFEGADKKHISQPRWEGKYLTGEEYVLHHAIPNIYFHVTTAYSILRHNGVEIGKKDFLGALPFKS